MSFEYYRDRPGQPRCRAKCDGDGCNVEDVFACEHGSDGQARRKLTSKGWAVAKKAILCPACERKKRAKDMAKPKETEPEMNEPRQPTREDRRQIVQMLEEVYDVDAGRYATGETDDSVASTLGVMPGWVAKIREEFFGPDGTNDDVEHLVDEVRATIEQAQEALKAHDAAAGQIRVAIAKAQEVETELGRIKRALGPRVLKVAGST